MTKLHTHYDNLKVSRDAPDFVIKAAYKALAQKYHPDRDSSADATRKTQIINDAYAELSDQSKRAAHDQWIARKELAAKPKEQPSIMSASEQAARMASELQRMRRLHRSDIQCIRTEYESKLAGERRISKFMTRWNILAGLLLSIPLHLLFSCVDNAINPAHAESVAQYQPKEAPMLRH